MKKFILCFCTTTLLFSFKLSAQNENFIHNTDSLLNYLYLNNRFCGTVYISKGDVELYNHTFPAKPDEVNITQYRIASISKMFTAVIIYQLAEENKLSLNDNLNLYFPEIKNAADITIMQMLGHQSGIADIINNDDFTSIKSKTLSREEVINQIEKYKPAFKPGKSTQYSNSNYILLGYIIEDMTKQSFADVVKTRICDPLNLKETTVESTDFDLHRNNGHLFNGEFWEPYLNETNESISSAAGAIVSSPHDLNIFIQALFKNKLIAPASLDSMCQITNKTYGHGIFYTPFYTHSGYGHTGHIDEFNSAVSYLSEDSLCFVLCLNGLNYPMNDIALPIFSDYFQKPFTFPVVETLHLSDAELEKYTGIYRIKIFHLIPITKIKVISQHGVLETATIKDFEEEKSIIEPIAPDLFKNFKFRTTLEFVYNNKEEIKGCNFQQGKTTFYCKKLK